MINKLITLPKDTLSRFASLPKERIVLATREHWITIVLPISFILVSLASVLALLGFVDRFFPIPFQILLAVVFLSILLSLLLITHTIVAWYSHYYILTSRKILDVRSFPLFYHSINDVLLDQVRCTEVDVHKNGVLQELFDVGTILLTFDRPTNQEAFTLNNIHMPEKIGIALGDVLDTIQLSRSGGNMFWYKENNSRGLRMADDIFPALPSLSV